MIDKLEEYSNEELDQEIQKCDSELRKRKWDFENLKQRKSKTEIVAYQRTIIELENRLRELPSEKHHRTKRRK